MALGASKFLNCLWLGLFLAAGSIAPLFHDAAAHGCGGCKTHFVATGHKGHFRAGPSGQVGQCDCDPLRRPADDSKRQDECSSCRYLAQPLTLAAIATAEISAELVEPVRTAQPLDEPCAAVRLHHSRAPPA